MTPFLRKLSWLARRRRKEAELEDELQFHLDEETDERIADGLSIAEARRAARRDFGNLPIVREDTRAAWTWTLLEQLAQDLRYGVRMLAANKTFSAMAILSLALGIGANTAIFSFMDAMLMRSLPVPDPEALVTLAWHTNTREMHGSNRHDDSYTDPSGGFVEWTVRMTCTAIMRCASSDRHRPTGPAWAVLLLDSEDRPVATRP